SPLISNKFSYCPSMILGGVARTFRGEPARRTPERFPTPGGRPDAGDRRRRVPADPQVPVPAALPSRLTPGRPGRPIVSAPRGGAGRGTRHDSVWLGRLKATPGRARRPARGF